MKKMPPNIMVERKIAPLLVHLKIVRISVENLHGNKGDLQLDKILTRERMSLNSLKQKIASRY